MIDSAQGKPAGRVELYTQMPMVNWLGPIELLKTGMRAAVATTLGAFADPREVQSLLNPQANNPPLSMPRAGFAEPAWVDYLADTGDGWNSTYSMAWCASRDLQLAHQGSKLDLPQGRALLLGGDQVYPTPAQGAYRTRFLDPFRAAFPAPVPDSPEEANNNKPVQSVERRWMLATPGNHDWYDGLRGFGQLFCSGKPIGAWDTVQRTSYYALQVCEGWWVWGLDLQLESSIDGPQLHYFRGVLERLQPGDRVVLCAPEPSWVDEAERVAREDKSLSTLETQTPRFSSLRQVEELLGDRLALVLAGDSHHYAHYAPRAGTAAPQRITCGGGGAFLHGTHQLPAKPDPIRVDGVRQHYTLQCAYPDAAASKTLRNRAWRLPTRNASFCGMLAMLYLMFTWMVQSASKIPHPVLGNRSLMESLSGLPFAWDNLWTAWLRLAAAMAHSPSSVLFAAAVVLGAGAFSLTGVKRARALAFFAGAVHGMLHLGLAVGLLWAMGTFNLGTLNFEVDSWRQVALFLVEVLGFGGTLGGLLFGVWMVLTNSVAGLHAEEVFSSQCIADNKCFLRMRFERDRLTVYAIKLEKVCRRWTVSPGVHLERRVKSTWKLRVPPGSATGPRFTPATPLQPALIEDPIVIERQGTTP
ncbi:MAG: preprotein translocase subunit YajC [Pseudomonadota bacterium]